MAPSAAPSEQDPATTRRRPRYGLALSAATYADDRDRVTESYGRNTERHNDGVGLFARESREGVVEIVLAHHLRRHDRQTETASRLFHVRYLELELRVAGINQRAKDRGLRHQFAEQANALAQ
jgi:hypothetical protein